MDAPLPLLDALGTGTLLWFGHECSGYRMLWEHARNYGLGMDAVVIGCTRNTNVSIPLPPHIPPTQSSETSQNRVRKSPRLLKHERYHGLGKDESSDAVELNIMMAWAWMLCRVIVCSRHERYYGLGPREYTRAVALRRL